MRGERLGFCITFGAQDGSSPHARGTLDSINACKTMHRFIPACAGNATGCPGSRCCSAVHPRMRGERKSGVYGSNGGDGSSPHARGTLEDDAKPFPVARFIPACAGNARARSICAQPTAVHPRMRGERCISSPITTSVSGSSPHARGTPGVSITKALAVRFIPACAGNATGSGPTTSQGTVHPRMRGERDFQIAA